MTNLGILSILLYIMSCTAQNRTANNVIGDDQANWAEMWKVMSKSSDGRSALADSTRPTLFDIILKANAEARHETNLRSDESEFLFQGDIAMSKRDVIRIVNAGGGRRKRAVMKKLARKLWQRNKLAYVISHSLGKFAKQNILAAIKEWDNTLPCMGKWRDITNVASSQRPRDYIFFIKGRGCYSKVGRQGGRQVISIGTGCEHVGVVVHEIGHAIGFWHEQSRADRDDYVQIHWHNILPAMRFNFEKYSASRINDLGVGYDYESVMHYGAKAFSKNGKSTISIKQGKNTNNVNLGQRYGLSDKDKQQAKLLYNCIVKSSPCNSNPCLNGGVCSSNGDKFSCKCTSGYTGAKCEKKAAQVCVDNDRRCPNWGNHGFCSPEKGYEDYMKKTCCATCRKRTAVKPCSSSPCLNSGICVDLGKSYRCSCTSRYTGARCERRVSPCSSFPCLNAGICRNNGNKFSCTCKFGYTGLRCETKKPTSTICTKNVRSQCENWKEYCVNYDGNTYYSFMKKNCCKTCEKHCKDKNKNCKQWSISYCHRDQFKKYMINNCPISCKYEC